VRSTGGRGGPKPQAHVLVVDEDDSALSGFLLGALSQEAAGNFVRAETVDLVSGRARIAKGEASALLIIPQGFSDAVLREEPCTLQLITNPAQRILPGMVEESLSILVDASFYIHRLLGEDLQRFAGGPGPGLFTFPDQQIADFSVKVNRLAESIRDYLDPLVIELEAATDKVEEEQEQPGFAQLFLPGILYMSLLFMAQGLSEDLWQERMQKTLRRIVYSPQSTAAFLAGKTLYGFLLMAAVGAVTLALGYLYFGLRASNLPLAIAWTAFSGVVLQVGMIALQLHCPSQRAASIVGMTLIFPLMMIGGSFFPFEAMPAWMVAIGKRTPNGWALQQLRGILEQQVEPQALGLAFVGLALTGGMLFVLSARRLGHGFAQG